MDRKKVLVTGASGLVGKVFLDHAHGKYELSALNRRAVDGIECLQADITDLAAIQPAFAGKDTVVHLAALAVADASFEQALNHNVIGTYNVFEAARQAGVRRVVFASSGAATMGWESEFPYNALIEGRYDEAPEAWRKVTHETPPRPGRVLRLEQDRRRGPGATLLRRLRHVDDLLAPGESQPREPPGGLA